MHIKKIEHNNTLADKWGFFQKQLWIWEPDTDNFCNFWSHLSLERVFPALKLTQNCSKIIKIALLENWQFHYKLAPSLLHMPERLTIYHETKSDSKIPIFQFFFSELGEIWKYNLPMLLNKNLNFPPLSWIWKNWDVQLEQHSKITKKKEKLHSRAKDQHSTLQVRI